MEFYVQVEICMGGRGKGYSLCGIGRVSACLVEFHVQMERCMGGGGVSFMWDTL